MSHRPIYLSLDWGIWFYNLLKFSPLFWAPKFNWAHEAAQEFRSTISIAQESSGCSEDELDLQPNTAKVPGCQAQPQELTFFSSSLCFSIASSKLKPTHSASSSGIANSCDRRRDRWYSPSR